MKHPRSPNSPLAFVILNYNGPELALPVLLIVVMIYQPCCYQPGYVDAEQHHSIWYVTVHYPPCVGPTSPTHCSMWNVAVTAAPGPGCAHFHQLRPPMLHRAVRLAHFCDGVGSGMLQAVFFFQPGFLFSSYIERNFCPASQDRANSDASFFLTSSFVDLISLFFKELFDCAIFSYRAFPVRNGPPPPGSGATGRRTSPCVGRNF